MAIRIGINGYGNLGRGVELAVKDAKDMELAAVFTRRDPASVKILTEGVPVVSASSMDQWTDKIDVLIAQNDDMALGAIDAIKAAGLVPGEDIIIVGCDSVKAAFEAIVAGEMNATIECTPLYGPFVEETIEALENGEEMSKEVIHPEEGVYDMDGGIDLGTVTSVAAADVIDERVY